MWIYYPFFSGFLWFIQPLLKLSSERGPFWGKSQNYNGFNCGPTSAIVFLCWPKPPCWCVFMKAVYLPLIFMVASLTLRQLQYCPSGSEVTPLQWCHNERNGISNHQPHDCLLSHLFGRRSKKTSKLFVTVLCAGNSPVTSEFPTQMASNAEIVSIWWRHLAEEYGQNSLLPNHITAQQIWNFSRKLHSKKQVSCDLLSVIPGNITVVISLSRT